MKTRRPTKERRLQITEAALRIISTRGVHRLTAIELGREVGIADGTVFRHFKDKAEIVRAAIAHLDALLFKDFPPVHEDPIQRLRAFFIGRLELLRSTPSAFLAAFTDRLEEAAGDDAHLVRAIIERSQGFVRQCLAEAAQRGLISSTTPPEALTMVVVGTLQATAFTHHRLGDKSPMKPEVVWQVLETLLRKSAG